jgi:HD-GYP domain-containing protein (c-di-GMP phosphodiesterase class II)
MSAGPREDDADDMQSPDLTSSHDRRARVAAVLRRSAPQADDVLDRLARGGATALGVPVALASIVGSGHQHFVGCAGLREPWATRRSTPLSHSFCRHVVEAARPLVVADARTDALVRDNPAIDELGVRAYAGMPLAPGGDVMGAFCAIDHRPRQWTGRELAALEEMAAAAARILEDRLTPQPVGEAACAAGVHVLREVLAARDRATLRHCERVAALAGALAGAMGWPPHRRALLRDAALVHDVGKVGVPDAVLFGTGSLGAGEVGVVRRHAALGGRIAAGALTREQVSWVRGHHERWDGTGYPDGLRGERIPEGARIIAVADSWDAMTAGRPYASARSAYDALAECRRERGHQFDPAVVAVLEGVVATASEGSGHAVKSRKCAV